jgi:hypothetical protein
MESACPNCGTIRVRDYIKPNTKAAHKFFISICKECRLNNMRNGEFGKLVSNSKLGKKRPNWVKQKLSESKKNKYVGEDNHFFGKKHSSDTIQKISNSRRLIAAKKNGYDSYEEYENSRSARETYYKLVWKLTKHVDKTLIKNYDKLIKDNTAGNEGAYHLDHIYPINEAFKKNISAENIADIRNLQFIPWLENQVKSNNITIIPEHIQYYLDNS